MKIDNNSTKQYKAPKGFVYKRNEDGVVIGNELILNETNDNIKNYCLVVDKNDSKHKKLLDTIEKMKWILNNTTMRKNNPL